MYFNGYCEATVVSSMQVLLQNTRSGRVGSPLALGQNSEILTRFHMHRSAERYRTAAAFSDVNQ